VTAGRYDITLAGNKYRILRDAEIGGYRKRFERRQVSEQQARNVNRLVLNSRGDRSVMWQDDWSGGSAWWKPLMSQLTATMYFDATAMDAFSKPGVVLPTNKATNPAATLAADSPMFSDGAETYAVSSDTSGAPSAHDLARWTGSDWDTTSQGSSGVLSGDPVYGVAHKDGLFYLLSDGYAVTLDPGTSADRDTLTGLTVAPGDNIFFSTQGRLLLYVEGIIHEVDLSDMSTSVLVDDGYGPDGVAGLGTSNPRMAATDPKLAVAHSSGVFYAKNVMVDGQPQCFLSRVDRDASGAHIRYPLTTLPLGLMCFGITVHLGSVVMACTRDWRLLLDNDTTASQTPIVEFYAQTQGSGLAVIGSPLRERPTEMPGKFLGTDNEFLYIGSGKRVWVYDGARGGIHPWLNPADQTGGLYDSVASVTLTSGGSALMLKRGAASSYYPTLALDPTTVTNFGDDLTTYSFESNYFDFGLPAEEKTLLEVDIFTEPATADQRFTLQLSADDGAFATVATHSNASYSRAQLSSPVTGRRFRYKVIYETKTAALVGLRGLQWGAASGVMVPVWSLAVNGREVLNVENQVMDPEDVFDNLEALAAGYAPVTLVDNFRSQRVDDSTTHSVLVYEVNIIKNDPNESIISVELVGSD
jgi:hypothetical protein